MGTVVAQASMSLDGYIAKTDNSIGRLFDWYEAGEDIDRNMPLLSTFLGHADPASTYWYLQAVPELLELVSGRLEQLHEVLS